MKNLIIEYQVKFIRLEKYAEALLEKQEFQSTYHIETSRTHAINNKRTQSSAFVRTETSDKSTLTVNEISTQTDGEKRLSSEKLNSFR